MFGNFLDTSGNAYQELESVPKVRAAVAESIDNYNA